MQDIRLRVESEFDEALCPGKMQPSVFEELPRDKYLIEHWQCRGELPSNNGAAKLNGRRLYRKMIANLIGNIVNEFCRYRALDRPFLVKKGDLPQQPVLWRDLRGAINYANLVAELSRDLGQDARVCGYPRSFC